MAGASPERKFFPLQVGNVLDESATPTKVGSVGGLVACRNLIYRRFGAWGKRTGTNVVYNTAVSPPPPRNFPGIVGVIDAWVGVDSGEIDWDVTTGIFVQVSSDGTTTKVVYVTSGGVFSVINDGRFESFNNNCSTLVENSGVLTVDDGILVVGSSFPSEVCSLIVNGGILNIDNGGTVLIGTDDNFNMQLIVEGTMTVTNGSTFTNVINFGGPPAVTITSSGSLTMDNGSDIGVTFASAGPLTISSPVSITTPGIGCKVEDTLLGNFYYTTSGLTVNFTDGSYSSAGPVSSWDWNFGDSGGSTLQNPIHTYSTPGTYLITFLPNNGTSNSEASASVTVT